MSEFFAEATVRLRPDLTEFIKELRGQIKAAVEAVESGARPPVVRIRPALTKNFVGDLRRQVNAAVDQAQRGVKPIRVRAEIMDFPRGQLREVSRRTLAGAGGGAGGGAAAFRGVAQGATLADKAVGKLFNTERLLNSAFGQSATLIGTVAQAQDANNAARTRGAKSGLQIIQRTIQESAATKALTQARRALATVELTAEGTRSRAQAARRAEAAILATLVIAEEEHAVAVKADAQAMLRRLQIIDASNAALRELSGTAAKSARSQEQLRRGALATSLSFLGIRGATLAASASFLAGAAAIGIFAKALQNASQFSDNLNVFRATTAATSQELEQVRDAARALGADIRLPGVSAADAAESMLELAKAGLGVQDSIDGARGVLLLATAAAIDNAQAVELAANALNAFQLQGRDATRVADVFANAANAAQGSIVDIGIAFQQAAAAGRQVGLSFEDTAQFLTVLAQNGLKGSDAGTSLRTALIRLIRPTEAAQKKLRDLNITLRDANGNLRPDIFIQLAEATKNLTPAMRDTVIALVGGQDAFRAISILGRQSIQDFIKLRRELRQQGTAAEIAAARNQGLKGSLDALGSTLSTAGTQVGQGITPAIQGLVGGLTAGTAAFAESATAATIFSGALASVNIAGAVLSGTIQAIAGPLLAVGSALTVVTQAVGVPTILAAVAAYKLMGPALLLVDKALKSTTLATIALSAAMRPSTFASAAFITSLKSLAGALPLVQIGIVAVAAALFFLITRETAAERATRQLTDATKGLVDAQSALRQASASREDTSLALNASRLGVLEAKAAATRVRSALANSRAGASSFARKKLELELAVAIDNVAIAEDRYQDAVFASLDAREAARQADRNARAAALEQVRTIERLISVERRRAQRPGEGRGGRNAAALVQQEVRAVQNVTRELLKRAAAARQENTAESRALANRLQILAAVSRATKQLPDKATIDIVINAKTANAALNALARQFDITAQQAKNVLANSLGAAASELPAALVRTSEDIRESYRNAMFAAGAAGGKALMDGTKEGIDANKGKVQASLADVVARSQGQLQGLERQALDISISGGSDEQTLANLQAQEARAREILAAQKKAFAAGKVAEESVRRAQEQLNGIVTQRRSLQDQLAADAKSAADDARQQQEQIDDDLLTALGIKRDTGQERRDIAAGTPGLRDDIARTRALRQLVIKQIGIVKEQIKTASIRIAAVRQLRIISRQLAREIKGLQDDRRQEIQDRIAESNQLDIDFASTTGNKAAEIRARQREIGRLRKLQALTKQGTIEYRRYRNLIAEQQQAIKDLKDEQKQTNDAFNKLLFESMQRQQGFAFNLLGNLIPGSATSGLVGNASATAGGSSPPLTDFGPRLGTGRGPDGGAIVPGLGAGGAAGGVAVPTRGQASTQVALLRQIVRLLERLDKGTGHPEAKNAKRLGSSVADTQ